MSRKTMLISASAFVLALSFHTNPAAAQNEATGSAATPQAGSSDGLEEIVVTAQRRSESLQRAAVAVTALNAESLERQAITSAAALTVAVPALQASNQAGATTFYIRGIGAAAYNPYTEPAVAFNMNGVYISRPTAVNGQFFDVQRVEVLKGPQGTLYGRNATGGAVNLIFRKPDYGQFNGTFGATYGNYDEVLLNGALNVPVGENGALRVAFQTEDHDGYFKDGTDDAKDRAFRVSLGAQLTPDLTVNVVGDYADIGGKGGGGSFLGINGKVFDNFLNVGGGNRIAFGNLNGAVIPPTRVGLGNPAYTALYNGHFLNFITPGLVAPLPQYLSKMDTQAGGVMAEFNLKTSLGTVTFIPAYRELHTDNFMTMISHWLVDRTDQKQTSLELRLASDDAQPLRYVLGAYYFNESADFLIEPDNQFVGVVQEQGNVSTKTAAAFGQLTYALNDTLRLTGGLRYTWEKKGIDGTHGIGIPASFTSGPNLNPLIVVPAAPEIIIDTTRTFKSATWKAGVEWDAGPQSLVYANVGTGFKAGGFFFAQSNNSYDPEKVTSYVLGTKNRFLNNRLQFNLEAYYLKYRNQQLAHLAFVQGLDPTRPVTGFPTENVGSSTIYGFEASVEFKPVRKLLLGVDVNYTHSRYDEFKYTVPDISLLPALGLPSGTLLPSTGCAFSLSGATYTINCSGRQMFQSPEWVISGRASYTIDLGSGGSLVPAVQSRYESARWLSDSFLPETHVGSNTRTDASLTYNAPGDHWSIAAYVNNIENDDVPSNVFLNSSHPIIPFVSATLRPPRTYGIRARVNF
ncbi:TonB-dependent receptor [Sphingobium subterraneum]|uniref:Iron complex outermembrane receptor protein n=1 Tax=Sphingobium subterraneum TaxID=627688 RepID=A0A841IXJ7_9SPHN|nr:TonB-dependent receptor [Sphingobium subterraneum]MBB6123094.1 iron complex outermembrane receptor protein [Sphingobium subterraneum]